MRHPYYLVYIPTIVGGIKIQNPKPQPRTDHVSRRSPVVIQYKKDLDSMLASKDHIIT